MDPEQIVEKLMAAFEKATEPLSTDEYIETAEALAEQLQLAAQTARDEM